jgi:hypothetical protein
MKNLSQTLRVLNSRNQQDPSTSLAEPTLIAREKPEQKR